MIALLLGAMIVVAVYRSPWFVDLVAGAALLCAPIALFDGRLDVAATALGLFALSVWRMRREA
ncbi:MAG: hypothetical protein ACRDPE_09270 [Solirubrobacterales bacterium]